MGILGLEILLEQAENVRLSDETLDLAVFVEHHHPVHAWRRVPPFPLSALAEASNAVRRLNVPRFSKARSSLTLWCFPMVT
jgi:hypothetical protein